MCGKKLYVRDQKLYVRRQKLYVRLLIYMCGTDFYIIVLQKVRYLCADNKSANGHPYSGRRIDTRVSLSVMAGIRETIKLA